MFGENEREGERERQRKREREKEKERARETGKVTERDRYVRSLSVDDGSPVAS